MNLRFELLKLLREDISFKAELINLIGDDLIDNTVVNSSLNRHSDELESEISFTGLKDESIIQQMGIDIRGEVNEGFVVLWKESKINKKQLKKEQTTKIIYSRYLMSTMEENEVKPLYYLKKLDELIDEVNEETVKYLSENKDKTILNALECLMVRSFGSLKG